MKTYSIYLIRNGLMEGAEAGRYIGHTDVPLSEEGRRQLEALRETKQYPAVEAVFSGPLLRCIETAQLLYPDRTPLLLDDLIEYKFGEFEGRTAEELREHPVFPAWLAGEPDAAPPFGESAAAFSKRIRRGFSLAAEGLLKTGIRRAAMVTHGGVIMAILSAFGLPELPMHEWRTAPGEGYALRITPSVWMRGQKLEVVSAIPFEKDA